MRSNSILDAAPQMDAIVSAMDRVCQVHPPTSEVCQSKLLKMYSGPSTSERRLAISYSCVQGAPFAKYIIHMVG